MKRLFLKYCWQTTYQRWIFIASIEVIFFTIAIVFFPTNSTIYYLTGWSTWLLIAIFLRVKELKDKKRERETIEVLHRYIIHTDGMSGTMGTGGNKKDFKFGR